MSDDCFITGLHGARAVSLSQRRSPEKKQKGGVDEIISQLIQRRDGAECARALAELSIQSPPQPGSKEARRWHALRKLISPHAFHHSHITGGKRRLSLSSCRTFPPPARFMRGRLCPHLTGTSFFRFRLSPICHCPERRLQGFLSAEPPFTRTCGFISPPTAAIRDKMLTCLSSTTVS